MITFIYVYLHPDIMAIEYQGKAWKTGNSVVVTVPPHLRGKHLRIIIEETVMLPSVRDVSASIAASRPVTALEAGDGPRRISTPVDCLPLDSLLLGLPIASGGVSWVTVEFEPHNQEKGVVVGEEIKLLNS